jgi:transposase-like protein
MAWIGARVIARSAGKPWRRSSKTKWPRRSTAISTNSGPMTLRSPQWRHLLTELGDIELDVPRTRRYSSTEVVRAYAGRTREIDWVILAGFVLGLSTRKVGETLLALLGRSVSPSTVSQVAKTLDAAVAAFHRRPLQDRYQALMLDGVMLARKTGAGALRARRAYGKPGAPARPETHQRGPGGRDIVADRT